MKKGKLIVIEGHKQHAHYMVEVSKDEENDAMEEEYEFTVWN